MGDFVKQFVLLAFGLAIAGTTSQATLSAGGTGICDIYNQQTGATKINCRERGINELSFVKTLPSSARELDLTWNSFSPLNPGTFQNLRNLTVLLLHHCDIRHIHVDAFVGLENLRKLNLGFNPLTLSYDSYPVGLFRPLHNLHVLLISAGSPREYPVKTILEAPNIQSLMFTQLSPPLPPPAELTHLDKLRALDFLESDIKRLKRDFLANVKKSNITSLGLRLCQQVDQGDIFIEDGALDNFPSLKTLNLACNLDLNISQLINSLSRISNTTIDSLILDGARGQGPFIFGEEDTETCRPFWLNLRRLSVRGCLLIGTQLNMKRCLPRLEVFALGFNTPLQIKKGNETIMRLDDLNRVLPRKLKTVDVSYAFNTNLNKIKDIAGCFLGSDHGMVEDEDYFRPTLDVKHVASLLPPQNRPKNCVNYNIPSSVTSFLIDHLALSRTGDVGCYAIKNNVRHVNISHCEDCTASLIGPLYGLQALEVADLSYGKFTLISPGSFRDLYSLVSLNVSHNNLNVGGFHLDLSSAPKLEELDLSANDISSLDSTILSDVHPNFKYMKLSDNNLNNLTLNLSRLPELRLLDLTGNKLESLPIDMCLLLNNIARNSSYKISLGLKNNPLLCQCSTIDFIQWLQNSSRISVQQLDQITCTNEDGQRQNLISVQIDKLKRYCSKSYPLETIALSVSLCTVVVAVLIVGLVYRHRWVIRWRVHVFRRYFGRRKHKQDLGIAYVLYCPEDAGISRWVHTTLVDKIEKGWGMKLYIPDRNDKPGYWISENIISGLESSQAAIWLLSRALVRSQTFDLSTNISLLVHGPRKILVVLFDPISSINPVPKHIHHIFKPGSQFNLLERTNDSSRERCFWNSMETFLTNLPSSSAGEGNN